MNMSKWLKIELATKIPGQEIIGAIIDQDGKIQRDPFISFYSRTLQRFFCEPTHFIPMPDQPDSIANDDSWQRRYVEKVDELAAERSRWEQKLWDILSSQKASHQIQLDKIQATLDLTEDDRQDRIKREALYQSQFDKYVKRNDELVKMIEELNSQLKILFQVSGWTEKEIANFELIKRAGTLIAVDKK
jgi:hypothetical protein